MKKIDANVEKIAWIHGYSGELNEANCPIRFINEKPKKEVRRPIEAIELQGKSCV